MSLADRIAVLQHGRVQQVDAPVVLYERPRTLFVATFIGSNNVFPGMVTADGGVAVHGLGVLPARSGGVPPGASASLAIRPEHITLDEMAPTLRGTVADTQFYGGQSTLAVDVPGWGRPVVVTQQGATRIGRGTPVGLRWDPAWAVVLAE